MFRLVKGCERLSCSEKSRIDPPYFTIRPLAPDVFRIQSFGLGSSALSVCGDEYASDLTTLVSPHLSPHQLHNSTVTRNSNQRLVPQQPPQQIKRRKRVRKIRAEHPKREEGCYGQDWLVKSPTKSRWAMGGLNVMMGIRSRDATKREEATSGMMGARICMFVFQSEFSA
jgi:hypothetical protein